MPETVQPIVLTREGAAFLQEAARHRYARICGKPPTEWQVVRSAEVGVWYDFCCPFTGTYGQCKADTPDTWSQEPRGAWPVILKHSPPKPPRKGRKGSEAAA